MQSHRSHHHLICTQSLYGIQRRVTGASWSNSDLPVLLCDPWVSPYCDSSYCCLELPSSCCRALGPTSGIEHITKGDALTLPFIWAQAVYKVEACTSKAVRRPTRSFSFSCKEKLLGNILFISGLQAGSGTCCSKGC